MKERGGIKFQLHFFIATALGGGKSLCHGRFRRYSPNWGLAELQSQYRDLGEQKHLFFPLGIRTPRPISPKPSRSTNCAIPVRQSPFQNIFKFTA